MLIQTQGVNKEKITAFPKKVRICFFGRQKQNFQKWREK